MAANPRATSVALVVCRWRGSVFICYIDESGCTGALPSADSPIQPVFVLAGLMIPHQRVKALSVEWINLKQKHFPNLLSDPKGSRFHDWMAAEVKGADVRKSARHSGRNKRRAAHRILNDFLGLLEGNGIRIAGRVYVKPIGGSFSGTAVYTSTAQGIGATFQSLLDHHGSTGFIVADSRNKPANATLSHSFFTLRHRAKGDPYPRIVEAPTFGHSDNHAGLQMADFLCSALLFPIASEVCCSRHLTNKMHCDSHYVELRDKFGARLKSLQWMYRPQGNHHQSGGITIKDQMNGGRSNSVLFESAHARPNAGAMEEALSAAINGGK